MVRRVILIIALTVFASSILWSDSYKIRPGDIVSLEVWDEEDLTGKFKVSEDGKIVINWLEPIHASGMTVEELKANILGILKKKYIKKPIIKSLAINEEIEEISTVGKGVTVVGAVKNEGVYKYRDGYTAVAAILDAGGFTKFAAKNRTYLVRGSGEQRKKYLIKMGDVMDKGDKKKDMILKPGDMIIVKEGFL